jgi:hypothetical protein
MLDSFEDRRRAPRSDVQDTLFIESISSAQVAALDTDLKTCSTVNVSACGLQVILEFEVLVDSDIALWVVQEGDGERILVSGIVRWTSKRAQENNYLVGIELNEDDAQAMQVWMGARLNGS